MSAQDDEEKAYNEAVARATQYGTMFLNDVFRFNNKNRQLFGTRGPRFSSLEVVWAILTALTVFILLLPFYLFLSGVFWAFELPFIAIYALAAGFFGRRLANTSPLGKKTGEGTGVWIVIQMRKLLVRISSLPIFPESFQAMHNKCYSIAIDPPRSVECVEWLGTAMAPRMPYNYNPYPENDDDVNEVDLYPRGERQYIAATSSVYSGMSEYFLFGKQAEVDEGDMEVYR